MQTMKAMALAAMMVMAVGCGSEAASEARGSSASAIEDSASSQVMNTAVNLQQIHPTESYGVLSAPVTKPFNDPSIEDQCGGSYSVEAAIDIGRVDEDSIEVKSVTYFYTGNRYALAPASWMSIGSTGNPGDGATSGIVQLDDNGVWYQTFQINKTFAGVRANDSGLVLVHWVSPDAPYIPGLDGQSLCGMNVKTLIQVIDGPA